MIRSFKPEGLASYSLGFAEPQENDSKMNQLKGEPQRGSVRRRIPLMDGTALRFALRKMRRVAFVPRVLRTLGCMKEGRWPSNMASEFVG